MSFLLSLIGSNSAILQMARILLILQIQHSELSTKTDLIEIGYLILSYCNDKYASVTKGLC